MFATGTIPEKKLTELRVYNLSKTSRDELIESLGKIFGTRQIKSHELKIAESDDPDYTIVFNENERLYLGKKRNPPVYFPLLKDEFLLAGCPTVTVDTGAVKFVCNGANIMRPGIVKIEGDFQAENIVLIKEERHGKPIAVGRAMVSRSEMEIATKGAVVTNLHYVGDKFWDMLKELAT